MYQFYVGVDIAKTDHYATVHDANGNTLVPPFLFKNTQEGYDLFISKIDKFDKDVLIIGFESTAHYAHLFKSYFQSKNYSLGEVNPSKTKTFRKLEDDTVKNDKRDSQIIANVLRLGFYFTPASTVGLIDQLRTFCTARQTTVAKRSKAKIQFTAHVDLLFPELHLVFRKNINSKTVYALFEEYKDVNQIANSRIDKLTNIIRKASRGHHGQEKAIKLKDLAKKSIGKSNSNLHFIVRTLINEIKMYDCSISAYDTEIKELTLSLNSPIMTIPGMGVKQAANILSIIKDFDLFDSPKKIVRYAGLNPIVRQSGNFNARTTRMSKRGNSLLRYSLVYAAHNVVKNNHTFHDYYTKKRNEGKNHYGALGHCAHKLIRLIYRLETTGEAFNPDLLF
jgi:transposase